MRSYGIYRRYWNIIERTVKHMDIIKGDRLVMKKKHPCGSNEMIVLRSGMDFKLRCVGCGREFMIPRSKAEKNVKTVIREAES